MNNYGNKMEDVNHLVWILPFYDICAMLLNGFKTLKIKLFSMREDRHMEETWLKWGRQTVCMLVWMEMTLSSQKILHLLRETNVGSNTWLY